MDASHDVPLALTPIPLTEPAFFAWLQRQDGRYELVDGQPRAMTGSRRRHDQVTVNALAALFQRLRGSPCRPCSADTAIRIPNGNIRYPDVSVDCGRFIEDDRAADAPVLLVEVLSPSTADFDRTRKLEEYKTVRSLRHILFIDPEQPQVGAYSRDASDIWTYALIRGLDAAVPIDTLDVTLPLGELFEGLAFRPVPRLVPPPREDGLG